MPDIIRNNAYRILGLDGNANQRDIMRRYREITSRLKIDDHPRYDLDLNMPDSFRTESSVDDALKKLQNRRSGLTEYFFWFSISDTVDEEAFEHLRHGDATSYGRAAQIWKNHPRTENSTGLSYKRNLAILYCLSMFNEENDTVLRESVLIWKAIVGSDKFWASFRKKYEMINDQKVHVGAMIDLKKNIATDISDIHYGLYAHHDNMKYVKEFHDVFGTFGPKTEKHLLKPIYQSVYGAIKKLKDVGDGNDSLGDGGLGGGILGDGGRKIAWVDEAVEQLELRVKQLRGLGLYDSDQMMVVRDHAAEAIGRASTMVHNEMHMREKSIELYNLAMNIAATAGMRKLVEHYANTVAEHITEDGEDPLVIEVTNRKDGFTYREYFTVKETFIECGTAKIYYKNVDAVMCSGTKSDYVFKITSNNDHVGIKTPDRLLFDKLIERVLPLAAPYLIDRLVKRVFEKHAPILMGDVLFDAIGYHRRDGSGSVLWSSDIIYVPDVTDNEITLHENKNGEPRRFVTVSRQEPNAIIIPELIGVCRREYHNRNRK